MTTSTLIELPKEQRRCRAILANAVAAGSVGAFLAAMLRSSLHKSVQAAASGDLAQMLVALEDLQTYGDE